MDTGNIIKNILKLKERVKMSENLFAYTATNSGYSKGTAGAINGERAAAATALSAVKNKIENLNW